VLAVLAYLNEMQAQDPLPGSPRKDVRREG
jgi:hypothetical protein